MGQSNIFQKGLEIVTDQGVHYILKGEADYRDQKKFYLVAAEEKEQKRTCFLKFVKEEKKNQIGINNLKREGRFCFCYPYIEKVYGNFRFTVLGQQYFGVSVEYILGDDLDDYRTELTKAVKQGRVSEEEAETIIFRQMRQFLYGIRYYITYAEDPYLHRDIKPENIRITKNGQDVKLVDFDFAHNAGSTATVMIGKQHRLGFSHRYSSPAVLWEGKPGIKEEIYSAGRVLCFWLIGDHYFTVEESIGHFEGSVLVEEYDLSEEEIPYCADKKLGYGMKMDRFPEKYKNKTYEKLIKILVKMCSDPDRGACYNSINEVIRDFEKFLQGYYGSYENYVSCMNIDESSLLPAERIRKEKIIDYSEAPYIVDVDGSVKEYGIRRIVLKNGKELNIYCINGRVYYIPDMTAKNIESSRPGDYEICDGDRLIIDGAGIEFEFAN